MSMHSADYYFKFHENGKLYIEGSDNSTLGNGVHNKDLERAILPRYFQGIKVYGTGYRSLAGLEKLTFAFIPNTYIEISADSFHTCSNLESVVFEDGSKLKTIGFWLLIGTKITTFTIPANVKSISVNSTFRGCTNLKTLYYQGMKDLVADSNTFKDVPSDLKIYVRSDYPYLQIGGRDVIKVLPPHASNIKTCNCKRNSRSINIMLVAVILST